MGRDQMGLFIGDDPLSTCITISQLIVLYNCIFLNSGFWTTVFLERRIQ
jgi:hypothetical protein